MLIPLILKSCMCDKYMALRSTKEDLSTAAGKSVVHEGIKWLHVAQRQIRRQQLFTYSTMMAFREIHWDFLHKKKV